MNGEILRWILGFLVSLASLWVAYLQLEKKKTPRGSSKVAASPPSDRSAKATKKSASTGGARYTIDENGALTYGPGKYVFFPESVRDLQTALEAANRLSDPRAADKARMAVLDEAIRRDEFNFACKAVRCFADSGLAAQYEGRIRYTVS